MNKLFKNQLNIKCVVCADIATGFKYYSVYSCEPCKAFFRRNALKNKEFKCNFGNNCKIDRLTRRFCNRCRLKKCFDVGMKKDSILSEDEKQLLKNKIKQNREKRLKTQISVNIVDSTTGDFDEENDILTEIIENNSLSEEEINAEIIEIENYIQNNDQTDDEINNNFKNSSIAVFRPLTDYRNNFNELEGMKLTEVLNATICFKQYCTNTNESVLDDFWLLSELWATKFEFDIRNTVKMCKNLSAFKNICAEDQVLLLKSSSLDIHYLRLIENSCYEAVKYNMENGQTVIICLNTYKDVPDNIYNVFHSYYQLIMSEWESDSVILDLLTLISLFNPNQQNLKHRDVVKYEQYVYTYLLQRYLQLRYRSESESQLKYQRLMNCLKLLRNMRQNVEKLIYQEKPKHLGPLLKEIYQ